MSNLYDYENKIENLIENQFPRFYQESGTGFIDFVKAYYAWLELENNPIKMARSLRSYRDVDTTPDSFLIFFKNKYLNNIQFTTASNKRLFIKNSLDFYRSKGTPRAVDLFFRLIYGVNADVYLPGEDVFRLSDAEWVKPKYLEVTHSDRNLDYLGKTITGLGSGATAFVDRLVRRRINGKFIDIFYISAIDGDFILNETLAYDDDVTDAPVVIGSLTSAEVIDGSNSFSVGDTVLISSNNGLQGKGTVTGTTNTTGQVSFSLLEGGWGYTTNTEILISNSVFTLANVSVTNTTISNSFIQFEKVYQPLANISYNTLAGGSLANGDVIEKYYPNGAIAGTGTIISTSASNSTAGTFLAQIGRLSNGSISNLNYTSSFAKPGNVVTGATVTYTDRTASANAIAIGSNTFITVNNVSAPFTIGETVYQSSGNGVLKSFTSNSTTTTLQLTNFQGIFYSPNSVTGSLSNSTANVISYTSTLGIVNVGNTFYTYNNTYIYGLSSNTFANLTNISNGVSANVKFTNLAYTETVYLNSDFIGANNSGNVPFLTIVLNGSNSNVASNGYGFAKLPSANINSRIFDALTYSQMNVGVVASLTNVNPGNAYSLAPFVIFHEKVYKGLYKLYYNATITNASKDFEQNEIVEQTITFSNSATLTVNNSANTWQVGEFVYQSNGTSNIATGILQAQTVSSNVGNLVIFSISGAFVTNSTARINGLTSGAIANINSVNTTSYFANARAIVQSQTNSSTLFLKRISTLDLETNGANLVGLSSGASATITSLTSQSPPPSGLNAIVTANVTASNGTVTNVTILDSGFGYVDGESATFTSLDSLRSGSLTLNLLNQGQSEGFFKSTKSFLSSDKKLQDGDFYQEFCVDPNSLILTTDLIWKKAEELKENDELIGFNENLVGRLKMEPSKVVRTKIIDMKKYKITTNKGETIVSENHMFVKYKKKRQGSKYEWIKTYDVSIGDKIMFAHEPWYFNETYENGWMAGFLDGEGWCSSKSMNGGFGQNSGIVFDKAFEQFKKNEINYYHNSKNNFNKVTSMGVWSTMKMLGTFRPIRLLKNSKDLWNGKSIYRKDAEKHTAIVEKIEEIGVGPVVTMETSTKTFISDGFLSHNSYQVKSPLAFEKYVDVLKKILHLAGTKPFGQVVHESVTNSYVNAVSYTSNIATANLFLNVANTSNVAIFTNGEVIYQTNGTANLGFATIRAPLKTLIQINTTNVNFIVGSEIRQPNTTTNSAFGYVASVTANSTVTNVYVVNSTAVFNSSANVFGPTKYVVAHQPKVRMIISSVTSGSNATQSFTIGENIYQGTIGSQTANGTVLNANLSTVEVRLNTGTFANGTTLKGQTSNCNATLSSYSNNTFTVGENVYAERTILYLRNVVNTFSNGEIVYQYKRNQNISNISFVNTAIGQIIDKNSSSVTITNQFGKFANNSTIFGSTSTANAVINKIMALTNTFATVITSNSSSVTLYKINGEFSNSQTLVGLSSNTYSNISTITPNNESYTPSSVINTLEVQIVNGFFIVNSSVNSIIGLTSSDTANLASIDYVQL